MVIVAFVVSLVISILTGGLLGFAVGRFIGQGFGTSSLRLISEIFGGLLGSAFGYDVGSRIMLAITYKAEDPDVRVRKASIPSYAAVAGGAWGFKRGWLIGIPITIGALVGMRVARNIGLSIGYGLLVSIAGAALSWLVVICVCAALGWILGVIFVLSPVQVSGHRKM